MRRYAEAAWERAMKIREVILRALAKRITWWQAAEIIGISDRSLRRWRERYEAQGYDGLFDRRRRQPSPKRVPLKVAEEVLRLYGEKYADLSPGNSRYLRAQERQNSRHHRTLASPLPLCASPGLQYFHLPRLPASTGSCASPISHLPEDN